MPRKVQKRGAARVALHRFHDCAALSVIYPNGTTGAGTVYLDAKAARAMARDLARLARSLESVPFARHDFKTEGFPAFESASASHDAAPAYRAPRIVPLEFTAPSAWAPGLVNGDFSGLEAAEADSARAWAKSLPGPIVSADWRGFMSRHDAYVFAPVAADCAAFTIHKTRKG